MENPKKKKKKKDQNAGLILDNSVKKNSTSFPNNQLKNLFTKCDEDTSDSTMSRLERMLK